jgi:hypothetical protein
MRRMARIEVEMSAIARGFSVYFGGECCRFNINQNIHNLNYQNAEILSVIRNHQNHLECNNATNKPRSFSPLSNYTD